MALWGKIDDANNAPNWLDSTDNDNNKSNDLDNAVFIDTTEAAVVANRAKGLQTPGWNLYHTYTDADGNTRHRVEPLVVMKVAQGDAGSDLGVTGNTAVEDAIAADSD